MKICYVGMYPPKAPRDRVYLEFLSSRGIILTEIIDNSAGFSKYAAIFKQLRTLTGDIDVMWLGYLSGALLPLVWLTSKQKIIYNALCSAYEAYVLDRREYKPFSLRAVWIWLTDFFAFHLADTVLVESNSQKDFLSRRFFVPRSRFEVVYTGVDESVFFPERTVPKRNDFTVVFRGQFIPGTGIEVVLDAAEKLKNKDVRFLIIGWGQLLPLVRETIRERALTNVELVTAFQEPEALRRQILSCHVMLGQFSAHPRLERTIQHKTAEALALGMPFVTRDSKSNRELLEDGVNCLFVPPADSQALVDRILYLRTQPDVMGRISTGARRLYEERLSPRILGESVYQLLRSV